MSEQRRATLGLLLVSVIWGTTFVAVKAATAGFSPLLFVGLRFALAGAAALPLLSRRRAANEAAPVPAARSPVFRQGILLGAVLAISYATQTAGLVTTTPTRSAFVTALNVVLVPFWAWLLLRQIPGWPAVAGLALTLPGIYLLTSPRGGAWNRGDSWTTLCAITYALYVALLARLDRSGARARGLLPAQLLAASVVCLAFSPLAETPRLALTPGPIAAFLWVSVVATTGTTWLMLRFQPRVTAARAAIIYATEPAFAAFFAWIFTREKLAGPAWIGAALILAGMLLSEAGAWLRSTRSTRGCPGASRDVKL